MISNSVYVKLGANSHHVRKNCDLEVSIFVLWRPVTVIEPLWLAYQHTKCLSYDEAGVVSKLDPVKYDFYWKRKKMDLLGWSEIVNPKREGFQGR